MEARNTEDSIKEHMFIIQKNLNSLYLVIAFGWGVIAIDSCFENSLPKYQMVIWAVSSTWLLLQGLLTFVKSVSIQGLGIEIGYSLRSKIIPYSDIERIELSKIERSYFHKTRIFHRITIFQKNKIASTGIGTMDKEIHHSITELLRAQNCIVTQG